MSRSFVFSYHNSGQPCPGSNPVTKEVCTHPEHEQNKLEFYRTLNSNKKTGLVFRPGRKRRKF